MSPQKKVFCQKRQIQNHHLKNQLGSVALGAEEDLVNGVLCQLILVACVLDAFRIESHKQSIVLR